MRNAAAMNGDATVNMQCVMCHAMISDAILWKQEMSGRRMCDACLMAMISDGGGDHWIENRINKALIIVGPYELQGPWKRSKAVNQRVTIADKVLQETAAAKVVKPKRKRKVKEEIVEAVFRELEG